VQKLDLIKIARPDHWFKNVFVLPGVFFGALISHSEIGVHDILMICYGLFIVCLTASSNYVINEILDATSDKNHPQKKHRPIPFRFIGAVSDSYSDRYLLEECSLRYFPINASRRLTRYFAF
jgi:4-hydroxybenzoate polyprenyltransferase